MCRIWRKHHCRIKSTDSSTGDTCPTPCLCATDECQEYIYEMKSDLRVCEMTERNAIHAHAGQFDPAAYIHNARSKSKELKTLTSWTSTNTLDVRLKSLSNACIWVLVLLMSNTKLWQLLVQYFKSKDSSMLAMSDTSSVKSRSMKVSLLTVRNVAFSSNEPMLSQIWCGLVHPTLWSRPGKISHWITCRRICSVVNISAANCRVFLRFATCMQMWNSGSSGRLQSTARQRPNWNFNLHLWASASVSPTHQNYWRGTRMSIKYWLGQFALYISFTAG